MRRFIFSAIAAATLVYTPLAAQVSNDVSIDLSLTAQPQITVEPIDDVVFTSTGGPFTAPQTMKLCFETSLVDVRITAEKSNTPLNGAPVLTNKDIDDYVNYTLRGGVFGTGSVLEPFNTTDTRDYDLTSADQANTGCTSDTAFQFQLVVRVVDDPTGPTRSIAEVIADSGLDDGTTYVFSDVLTMTVEPIL